MIMDGLVAGVPHACSPDWIAQMHENQQRWFVFIGKLEERARELCEAAMPELRAAVRDDPDVYKRISGRILAGINGQLENMRQKAAEVREEKIEGFFAAHCDDEAGYELLLSFRSACMACEHGFEETLAECRRQLEAAGTRDYEAEYRQILDEFEAGKDKFFCPQCGSPIRIARLFFLTTYVACPNCRTRCTFEPGSLARQLESIGRKLAEHRCADMLEAYEAECRRERDLYQRIHENRETPCDDAVTREARVAENRRLAREREDALARAPSMYEAYLRAMFDEWNRIVPDLTEQNERFYGRMLNDFRRWG